MTKLNLKQKIEQTTDWLYNKFCGATIGRLPGLYKRSLFISSVYGLLKENKNPEAVNLKRLNDLLQINYSQEGFSTGIQVTSLIWHNLEKHPTVHCGAGDFCLYEVANDDIMSASKVNAIIDLILENTPDWLCYGSPRLMRHDLYVLIRNLNIVGKVSVA
jgi:hypothetical protein